jgi:hypothetical protein
MLFRQAQRLKVAHNPHFNFGDAWRALSKAEKAEYKQVPHAAVLPAAAPAAAPATAPGAASMVNTHTNTAAAATLAARRGGVARLPPPPTTPLRRRGATPRPNARGDPRPPPTPKRPPPPPPPQPPPSKTGTMPSQPSLWQLATPKQKPAALAGPRGPRP